LDAGVVYENKKKDPGFDLYWLAVALRKVKGFFDEIISSFYISFFKRKVQKGNNSGHYRKLGIFVNKTRPVKLCNGGNESIGDGKSV